MLNSWCPFAGHFDQCSNAVLQQPPNHGWKENNVTYHGLCLVTFLLEYPVRLDCAASPHMLMIWRLNKVYRDVWTFTPWSHEAWTNCVHVWATWTRHSLHTLRNAICTQQSIVLTRLINIHLYVCSAESCFYVRHITSHLSIYSSASCRLLKLH